jgi:hypothetical protein
MLKAIKLSVIWLNVVMINVTYFYCNAEFDYTDYTIIMLNVNKLSVIRLNVTMVNVVAPMNSL